MKTCVFWFRRDLRIEDNAGLYHALRSGMKVAPVFIYDRNILDDLDDECDRRVQFIYDQLRACNQALQLFGARMNVYEGEPVEVFEEIIGTYSPQAVFTNNDYEPYAKERDARVQQMLERKGIRFQGYKDQVIFEKNQIVKSDGSPYTVFTPYAQAWKARLLNSPPLSFDTLAYSNSYLKEAPKEIVFPLGFVPCAKPYGVQVPAITSELLVHYHDNRDFPALDATTRISVHVRFGTVSIRYLVQQSLQHSTALLNELIWREFFMMILWHFPRVVHTSFRRSYDNIRWRNNNGEFERWCKGTTGYPLVDAGMRELSASGYMHNRVRMVVASFLCKHLLIDWRWGEAWFAQKLLDYDLAANNGNWQWAAGSGCDAAPYFRIFNPELQLKKFDPKGVYIRRWLPEWGTAAYPEPIVPHTVARERCLQVYRQALRPETH
jgi:deoxyribodipyrimidine photo-lyase